MERVNPLVTLREAAGLRPVDLAHHAGVTAQVVTRAEQAVFTTPPPNLLQALWRFAPEDDLHDYDVLLADYQDYQRCVRVRNYGALDPLFRFWTSVHPFTAWRVESEITSRIAISKLFCVHPAIVFKFEVQPWLVAKVPNDLLRALADSGYDRNLLDQLSNAYEMYKATAKVKTTVPPDVNDVDTNDESAVEVLND